MMFGFPRRVLSDYASYAFFEDAFTPEECDRIRNMIPPENFSPAIVGNEGGTVAKQIRDADTHFIHPDSPEALWIFERIAKFVISCNDARWGFQLAGLLEGVQLTRYREGQFYDWHLDSGPADFSARKLSVVIQLSDDAAYEGCDLQFIDCRKDPPRRKIGTMFLFPSYLAHRVTKLTNGERFSLVAWINGDPYR